MTFDRIDRQFKRREIKLECVDCTTTKDVDAHGDGDVPLCKSCRHAREVEACWGY